MIDTITYVHTDSLHGLLTTHSLIDSSIIVERAWRGPGAPDSGTQKRGRLSGQLPREMNQGEITRTMAISETHFWLVYSQIWMPRCAFACACA